MPVKYGDPTLHQLEVDGLTVTVTRKPMKHLRLMVLPPDGQVRVSAPLATDDAAVRLAVSAHLDWIRRQQAKLAQQARQIAPAYVSGERQAFQGEVCTLNLIEGAGPNRVARREQTIDLYMRPGSTPAQRAQVMAAWHRDVLRAALPPLIARWEPILGVTVAEWRIKRMKTRWGTCNPQARRIWINLELAQKPPRCLEYIVVHEMVHLLERRHNAHFRALMSQFLPDWQARRAELNPQARERR